MDLISSGRHNQPVSARIPIEVRPELLDQPPVIHRFFTFVQFSDKRGCSSIVKKPGD